MEPTPFDDLDPPAQIAVVSAALDALSAKLSDTLTRLQAIRVEVGDPDGLVRVTLGDDGRLLELWITDGAPRQWTNLELESRLNELIALGNDELAAAHAEVMGSDEHAYAGQVLDFT